LPVFSIPPAHLAPASNVSTVLLLSRAKQLASGVVALFGQAVARQGIVERLFSRGWCVMGPSITHSRRQIAPSMVGARTLYAWRHGARLLGQHLHAVHANQGEEHRIGYVLLRKRQPREGVLDHSIRWRSMYGTTLAAELWVCSDGLVAISGLTQVDGSTCDS